MKSRSTLYILIALASGNAASAAEYACPIMKGDPLVSADLFDGPVADNAILAPDTTKGTTQKGRSTWAVSGVFDEGRYLVIGCRYRSANDPVFVDIRQRVKTCEQMFDAKAGGSFRCR